MSWPTCPAAIDMGDELSLACSLPKGHEYDGSPYHVDPAEGVRWTITHTEHSEITLAAFE